VPVVPPGACCATSCSSNCPPCPSIKCAAGSHAETLPGSCCPACVGDGGAACQMGLQAYAAERAAISNKYQYGCSSASECVVIAPLNRCEQGCSYAAVWYGLADSFGPLLSNSADKYCSGCQLGPVPPCAPPPALQCLSGQCTFLPK
jgi:hypothetical protein